MLRSRSNQHRRLPHAAGPGDDGATPGPARRDILRLGGASALALALASCTGSGSTPAPHSTSGTPSSASPSPTPTGSADPTPSVSASPTVATLGELERQLSGRLDRRGNAGFRPADLLYNPRFATQASPTAIARCADAADVRACVMYATQNQMPLRIRNGGHSYGGWSSGPGLVIDLAAMDSVSVDRTRTSATIGAGALLAHVYSGVAAHGLGLGAGSCPTVGVTGLTLGGGVGVLARAYGLTCDQLSSADVVLADGTATTASPTVNPDLFWALRGGGGSFAAVTSLRFRLQPAPTITRFYLQWSSSSAASVLAAWQEWIAGTPRELWSTCKILTDPGTASFVSVSGTWIGTGSLDRILQRLTASVPPPAERYITTADYASTMLAEAGCANQTADSCLSDALSPAKRQPFAATSSILARPLPGAGIAAVVSAVLAGQDVPHLVEGGVSFDSLGGAVADVGPSATAVPWREAVATVQYTATWDYSDARLDPAPFDAYVRSARQALTPWLGSAAYVNYADPQIQQYATAYWGANLPRLSAIKKRYDPTNVFSFPQSVPLGR